MGWRSFQELQMRSCSGQLAFSIWCFEQASIQGDSSQSSFPSSPCSLATPKNHVMHLIEWHQRSRKPSKAWLFHQPQRWQLCCRQEKLPTEEPWVRMTLLYKRFHKFTRFPAQVWIWTVRDKSWQDLEVCPVKSATFPMLRKRQCEKTLDGVEPFFTLGSARQWAGCAKSRARSPSPCTRCCMLWMTPVHMKFFHFDRKKKQLFMFDRKKI